MKKELIKRIILENQEIIPCMDVMPRDYAVEPEGNYIIIGPRRCGKTYFLYRLIQDYTEMHKSVKQILYINFEDVRMTDLRSWQLDMIIEAYKELYDLDPVLFFDEIQIIPGWQDYLRRTADQKYRIYVSSNSTDLAGPDMICDLAGRFIVMYFDNLSFKEFLYFKGIKLDQESGEDQSRFKILNKFREYMLSGGFPELLQLKDSRSYLSNLFRKVYYGDIISGHLVRNEMGLKLMIKAMAESTGEETAFNHIKTLIKSCGAEIGTTTVIEYFHFLEKRFLMYQLSNYYSKFKKRESKRKFYMPDNGILNLFLFDSMGKLFENLVFNELRRIKLADFYYVRDYFHLDFFLPDRQIAIQVVWDAENRKLMKKEIRSLKAMSKKLDINEAFILTFNEEFELDDRYFIIRIIPAWKWILNM